MEIIHNSTGGRVPKFWRPPFGDSDNRVRAIASEVFGLTTLMWNQEYVSSFFFFVMFSHILSSTEDWSLTTGGTTPQIVNASMTQWITGIIFLVPETNDPRLNSCRTKIPWSHYPGA